MPNQRKSEWLEGSDWDFHEKQFEKPYRLTVSFYQWLHELAAIAPDKAAQILYVGAGMGANLMHLSNFVPGNSCTGVELNPECVRRGKSKLVEIGATDCCLMQGDLFDLPGSFKNKFEGVISLATLSWLPEFEPAALRLIELQPSWIALTSLFCPGSTEATIATRDYSRPLSNQEYTEKFYNVYSLNRTCSFFERHGYGDFHSHRFEIDIDLPRPLHGGMGTYTEQLADGGRLQISGPVLMNWHFILAKRTI